MSDTPRTDALFKAMHDCTGKYAKYPDEISDDAMLTDMAEHARQLERELNAMTLRCQAADRTANAALAELATLPTFKASETQGRPESE